MDPNQKPDEPQQQPDQNKIIDPVATSPPPAPVQPVLPEASQSPITQIPVQQPVPAPTPVETQPVYQEPINTPPSEQSQQPTVIAPEVIVPIVASVQQDATITPQVIGIQTDQPVTQSPIARNSDDVDTKKPSLVLGFIALGLSFFIGIIGAIVGIVALIKGIKSGRKGLSILGGLALFIGLALTAVALFIVVPLVNKLSYSGKTLSYISSKCEQGKFSFIYPEELNKKTDDGYSVELSQLFNDSSASTGGNSMAVINAECAFIGSEYLSDSEAITAFEQELPAALEEFVKDAKNFGYTDISASSFKPYTTSNISGKAWVSDVNGKFKDQKMYGKIIVAIGKEDIYSYTLYAIDDVWRTNKSVWDKSIQSLTLE